MQRRGPSAEMTSSSRLPTQQLGTSRPSSAACAITVAYRLKLDSVAHTGATMPFRYENGSIESKRARGAWPVELSGQKQCHATAAL